MRTVIWFFGTRNFASTRMFAGLTRHGNAHGWRVLALPRPRGDASMKATLAFWRPDGIVADAHYDPRAFGKTAVVNMAMRPAAYTGKAVFVTNPINETVRLAADELLTLGYRHFAFVNAMGVKYWSREREKCFRRFLSEHGFSCSVCESSDADRRDPLRFQKRLRRFLAKLPKPCAVLAAHDPVGRDILYAAEALGLSVPGDIAVCGIDNDTDICLSTNPTLTSVFNDYERAGELIGLAFEGLFAGRAVPDGVFRPSAVIRRASTMPHVHQDVSVVRAQEFIRREVARGLTAAEVVAQLDCSPRMAQLRFRKAVGHSIMREIILARITETKRLLADTSLPFEAVAHLSGWHALRNLQHHFQRETGQSLTDWQRSAGTSA